MTDARDPKICAEGGLGPKGMESLDLFVLSRQTSAVIAHVRPYCLAWRWTRPGTGLDFPRHR